MPPNSPAALPASSSVPAPLLTEAEAAKLLRVSLNTLINYRKRGLIEFIRFTERGIRYELPAVQRFLDRSRHAATQEAVA